MFSQNSRHRDKNAVGDGEASQPLLNGSHEDLPGGDSEDSPHLLFAASDDEDSEDHGGRSVTPRRGEHTVRFREEVQVIGPPLRSTIQCRETGACQKQNSSTRFRNAGTEYELDSDDLDDTALAEIGRQQQRTARTSGPGRRGRRPQPLLVGLMDSATRRTPETTIPMYESGNQGSLSDLNLSDVAAKQHAGGGLLDSVANMANSILGAGKPYTTHFVVH